MSLPERWDGVSIARRSSCCIGGDQHFPRRLHSAEALRGNGVGAGDIGVAGFGGDAPGRISAANKVTQATAIAASGMTHNTEVYVCKFQRPSMSYTWRDD